MAACSETLDEERFMPIPKMPPLPSLSVDSMSEDESFVVLGKSIDCDQSYIYPFDMASHLKVLEAAERNVDEELSKVNEKSSSMKPAVESHHFEPILETSPQSIDLASCSVEDIQQQVNSLIEENRRLKKIINENNESMQTQYKRIIAWQNDVENTYQIHKDKFEEAKKYIALLKSEIAKLSRQERKESKAMTESRASEGSDEISGLKISFEDLKIKNDLEVEIAGLKKTVDDLKSKNDKLESQNAQLNMAYVKSLKQRSMNDAEAIEEELRNTRHQLMQAQEKITELECAKSLFNEQLKAKDNEIASLKKTVEERKSTEEEMFVLQEQLAVYKADFEAEKNAKEMIRQEKHQLAEDIHHLQERNKKLRDELEASRPTGSFFKRPVQESPKESVYKYECPKCPFKFSTYNALENHVHRCLDLADNFS